MKWSWLLLLLPCGSVLFLLERLYRHRQREQQADLVPRWKAFLEQPAADGEPTIRPANVPNVRVLKAETVDRFWRFRKGAR